MNCTAFHACRKIAAGDPSQVLTVIKDLPQGEVAVFDDATGRIVDLDLREAAAQIGTEAEVRGRGRPRLGVTAREVTLLPRHWDWLNSQPGGASVALRKLVEEARRTSGARDRVRNAQESAYRFMSAIAGDLPGFEEASRALFAYDRRRFAEQVTQWPDDVRDYVIALAFSDS